MTRYEVDFLLKMRPKIESTPKPAGLQPPDRVDILWDGKVGGGRKRGETSTRRERVFACGWVDGATVGKRLRADSRPQTYLVGRTQNARFGTYCSTSTLHPI